MKIRNYYNEKTFLVFICLILGLVNKVGNVLGQEPLGDVFIVNGFLQESCDRCRGDRYLVVGKVLI